MKVADRAMCPEGLKVPAVRLLVPRKSVVEGFMNSSPASKKQDSSKRDYRRQDLERRRAERKWYDPAIRRESHALRSGRGRVGDREER